MLTSMQFRPAGPQANEHGHGAVESKVRSGFTLFEMMLVVVLLVVIASFCWPTLNKAFSHERVKKAADIVRTQWCKSRIKAMSGNQIFLFRYEMGGSHFRIEQMNEVTSFENLFGADAPLDSNDAFNAMPLVDPSTTSAGSSDDSNFASANGVQSLPKGIVFRGAVIENDSRAMTTGTNAAGAEQDASLPYGGTWSAPIYFYPDGTSSSARLQICNDRNFGIELALRGLTGVVKVSEIAAVEGALP
jgi:prepilin-type N-terminal cleavage/methylation domain-containing protein